MDVEKEKLYDNFNKEDYYTANEVCRELNITLSQIRNYDINLFKPVFNGRNKYYSKEQIQKFIKLKENSILSIEIQKKYNYSSSDPVKTIVKKLKQDGKKVDIIESKDHPFGQGYLIVGYEEVIKYIEEQNSFKNLDNHYEKFRYKTQELSLINDNIKQTIKDFHSFIINRYNDLKDKRVAFNSHIRLYSYLMKYLSKDLILHNEEEFKTLLRKINKDKQYCEVDEKELSLFVMYSKNNNTKSKLPDVLYTEKETSKDKKESKYYTKEQWYSFASLLYNSFEDKTMIDKSINNRNVAMTWAYFFLHYIIPWRAGDFFDIPKPDLSLISFNNGKEFIQFLKNGGQFTQDMGDIICYDITIKIKGYCNNANKNGQPLKFVVSESLIKPLGFLLALCEAHRQTKNMKTANKKQLITRSVTNIESHYSLFNKETYDAIFKGDIFSNTKATNTYSKLLEEEGAKDNPALAMYLPSVARPHKATLGSPSSTTADIYLAHAHSSSEDIKKLTQHIYERGFASSVPYKLLYFLNSNIKDIELNEQTKAIMALNLKPSQIHELSRAVSSKKSEVDTLLNQIIASGEDTVKQVLFNLISGKGTSKHQYADCLVKAVLYTNDNKSFIENSEIKKDKCLYSSCATCFGCPFLVGEKYFLIEVSEKIKETIEKFNSAKFDRDKIRYINLMQRLQNIIYDAVMVLGKTKVKTYISNDLMVQMATLEKARTSLLEGTGEN